MDNTTKLELFTPEIQIEKRNGGFVAACDWSDRAFAQPGRVDGSIRTHYTHKTAPEAIDALLAAMAALGVALDGVGGPPQLTYGIPGSAAHQNLRAVAAAKIEAARRGWTFSHGSAYAV